MAICLLAGSAVAAVDGASRTQRFRYDAESSYAILTLPGVPTDLQLGADEHVSGFALGDTIQWMVEELPGHVFIKPLKADLFTAGTLVTDRRTYQLTLRSGRAHDDWMQRVSWSYPDIVALRAAVPGLLAHDAEQVPAPPLAVTPGRLAQRAPASVTHAAAPGMDPAQLDFDYRISGEAVFRPATVFDDGRTTWMRLPRGELMPALFGEDADGERMVHFAVRGDWLVAPRVAEAWVLRSGRAEVRVSRHAGGARQVQGPPPEFWR
ncbi:MAG: TrbG/VirB9 family P-type conjugative transfer protein [Pseudomonadota bacterium]|nr:TrbG/VirB9 family P-type conjugative transfer protein [Pseudomonadota bacterium]